MMKSGGRDVRKGFMAARHPLGHQIPRGRNQRAEIMQPRACIGT